LRPGELQRMTAGSGIRHSEFNPSQSEPVHLYQIWLLPREAGLAPSYEQKAFDPAARNGRWQLVASPNGADGSLTIQNDSRLYLADSDADATVPFDLAPNRHAWLQILRGAAELNGKPLLAGDGAAVSHEPHLTVRATSPAELMLFDLA
jgi:quercetin 2,3-dioxygenase